MKQHRGDALLVGVGFALCGGLLAVVLSVTGCQALAAAAPVVLGTIERVLADEIERAQDRGDTSRERELVDAKRTLDEARAAADAAKAAADAALEAAARADAAREAVERWREDWQRKRQAAAAKRLARKLVKLRLAKAPVEAPDAGADAAQVVDAVGQ